MLDHLHDELKTLLALIVAKAGGVVVISYEDFENFMQEERVLAANHDPETDSIILQVEVVGQ